RLCLAQYRHARFPARGRAVRLDHRKAAGAQDRLSRGNRLAQRLDRRRGAAEARGAPRELGLWPISQGARERGDAMKVTPLALPEILLLEPRVFEDARGAFFESFNLTRFSEVTGQAPSFVQDNQSVSRRGVVRGLHYQVDPAAQGKLVRVLSGAAYDVAVDLRRSSPNFGRWVAEVLSAENRRQIWIRSEEHTSELQSLAYL